MGHLPGNCRHLRCLCPFLNWKSSLQLDNHNIITRVWRNLANSNTRCEWFSDANTYSSWFWVLSVWIETFVSTHCYWSFGFLQTDYVVIIENFPEVRDIQFWALVFVSLMVDIPTQPFKCMFCFARASIWVFGWFLDIIHRRICWSCVDDAGFPDNLGEGCASSFWVPLEAEGREVFRPTLSG